MALFIIHKNAQFSRDFKIHIEDCVHLPQKQQRIYIDGYSSVDELLQQLNDQVLINQGVYYTCTCCRELTLQALDKVGDIYLEHPKS